MNQMLNLRAQVLLSQLANNNQRIADFRSATDHYKIRRLIDDRRQIKAELVNEFNLDEFDGKHAYGDAQESFDDAENYINSWTTQITQTYSKHFDFDNREFCDMFLDNALPSAWHFNNDAIVLIDPPSNQIIQTAKERGQKIIVIYYTNDHSKTSPETTTDEKTVFICHSVDNLEQTFALLQTPAHKIITIPCQFDTKTIDQAKHAIADAIKAGKRTRFENTRTVSKFGKSWAHNVVKNLPELFASKNLHDFNVLGVENAVIVASGPSLNKNVHILKKIQDEVFIVSALRSLPVLLEAGVSPDLVIQLDAESEEVAKDLALDGNYEIENFLFEGVVDPGFLKIKAKHTIWSLSQHFFDIHKKLNTKPTPFSGPSVSIYALYLCNFLKFKNICFVGQDLAAEGGKQYADGATTLLPNHHKISMFQIEVPGFYGTPVMTRNSYQYQINRCSEIAHAWATEQPDLNLFNATEGGAFIEGFEHVSLEEFAKKCKQPNRNGQKQVVFLEKHSVTPEIVESFLEDFSFKMSQVISIANLIIKLDSKAEKKPGLHKKIKKSIEKFQALNDTTSLLQLAMQENIAKVIGTSQDGQKIDNYTEFFQKIKTHAIALKFALNN